MKHAFFSLLCLAGVMHGFAQEETPVSRSNKFIGIQANQLIRQVLNFGNTSSAIQNPYAFTFASNSPTTGRGINVGVGYAFDQLRDGNAITSRDIKTNEFFIRFGYERKHTIAKNLMFGHGVDLVGEIVGDMTSTNSNNGQFIVETNNKRRGTGLGPRFALNYRLHDRLLIGTEANYYYVWGKVDSKVTTKILTTIFDPVTGQPQQFAHTEITESSEKFKRFRFNAPAIIFLILQF